MQSIMLLGIVYSVPKIGQLGVPIVLRLTDAYFMWMGDTDEASFQILSDLSFRLE